MPANDFPIVTKGAPVLPDLWYNPVAEAVTALRTSVNSLAAKPLFARRTSDSAAVNNSTTLVNDTQLLLPVEASLTYRMECRLKYSTGTTPDMKFAWTFPAGLTMSYGAMMVQAGTSGWGMYEWTQSDVVAVEGGLPVAWLTGLVVVSGTAGTLQLQFAQNTANASDTRLLAGSYLMLMRVE